MQRARREIVFVFIACLSLSYWIKQEQNMETGRQPKLRQQDSSDVKNGVKQAVFLVCDMSLILSWKLKKKFFQDKEEQSKEK